MDLDNRVGVLGGRSLVGSFLLPELVASGYHVTAFSRRGSSESDEVEWRVLNESSVKRHGVGPGDSIGLWVSLLPIWILAEMLPLVELYNPKRIVALSSTSVLSKVGSPDPRERRLARDLSAGENDLVAWARSHHITWLCMRPTLIYGAGKDENIMQIASFIKRFRFFPILGGGSGLRQPVYGGDVARACINGLQRIELSERTYNLSGGEVLSYREMVVRIFQALDCSVRIVSLPIWVFGCAVWVRRIMLQDHQWNLAMAKRMQEDLTFDHDAAALDLSFCPRRFEITADELNPQT